MQSYRTRQTAFLISNLHCASCVNSIGKALDTLEPPPLSVTHSIIEHTITVTYPASQSEQHLKEIIENEGYEVEAIIANPLSHNPRVLSETRSGTDQMCDRPRSQQLLMSDTKYNAQQSTLEKHRLNCKQCQIEYGEAAPELPEISIVHDPTSKSFVAIEPATIPQLYVATLTIDGMSCASCVGNISKALEAQAWVEESNVNLLTNSATITMRGKDHVDDLVYVIQDAGYDATIDKVELQVPPSRASSQSTLLDIWRATYTIDGLTCASCVGNVTRALGDIGWIHKVDVNLIAGSAVVVFEGKDNLNEIAQRIEEIGYEASLNLVTEAGSTQQLSKSSASRTVQIRIEGMYCEHCASKISNTLAKLDDLKVDQMPSLKDPIVSLTYIPHAPTLTIRSILAAISAADPAFHPAIHHPMTIEERARKMHIREQRFILARLLLSVVVAIPTFIIGIVLMTLVSKDSMARHYIMTPIAGISRAEWALFIMATPVYFFAADIFHRRMLKELRALWRRRSPVPIYKRFYRFGSMNMLISLGTTIAFFSSIIEMALTGASNHGNDVMERENPTYFDSVVFLTMFLLIGRYIEAHSKAKTGDAVASLGKLRPTTALLQVENGVVSEGGQFLDGFQKVNVDLIDRGDVVRVPHGASPPCDGIVTSGATNFDESSLTGESRPISKSEGDEVFSGTVNVGPAVSIRVTGVSGNSMLDQIMRVVREGQAKRAPIERVADRITSSFVPAVCLIAITTWLVWLGLGMGGVLPLTWRDTADNWPFWSLQFAIAVFVVACPCGIGLAAPTALFVGGGLAAKFGILVKGGGEAFQEASNLDCIIFDKTGTLTQGDEPVVTDFEQVNEYPDLVLGKEMIVSIAKAIEEDSTHPLAKAIANFSKELILPKHEHAIGQETEELPGRGMKGTVRLRTSEMQHDQEIQVIIGNEKLMQEHGALTPPHVDRTLHQWKKQGKSVMLMALKMQQAKAPEESEGWWTVAIFSISDPIRPEAPEVVAALQNRNIDVWMISGDNATTAFAIGEKLGIFRENIIAGVLPEQKAEKVKMLQASQSKRGNRRATVAMVGDGINDSPALTNADVGIAIGSGSDVAINAASFVLLTSELTSLLTLIDLSRAVFRRIKFNFFWALIYNMAALPVAAGVLYPVVTSGGSHIRLDPAWAALAMALSSVSVVCSSLLLRSKLPVVGFRAKNA